MTRPGKISDNIADDLIKFLGGPKSYEILIPNYFYTRWEMDLFRLTNSEMVVEYEIKISKADFKNDFKKTYTTGWGQNQKEHSKHGDMANKNCDVNRFFFVVPKGLITADEVPKYAGLIYHTGTIFTTIKPAPLIHNKKVTAIDPDIYKRLSRLLALRSGIYRKKLRYLTTSIREAKLKATR